MRKELRIEIYFGWKDWICSKIRYGIRIQSFWIGISMAMPRRDLEGREKKKKEWVKTISTE